MQRVADAGVYTWEATSPVLSEIASSPIDAELVTMLQYCRNIVIRNMLLARIALSTPACREVLHLSASSV